MGITLSIIPFKKISNDNRIDLIIEGFVEDLVTNLSRFGGLNIISARPGFFIDSNERDEKQDALSDYSLTGSFRFLNDQLRIGIQLSRSENGQLVFAHNYLEKLDRLAEMQDEMVMQIVNNLQHQIDYDLLSFSYKKNPVQLAVYEKYLQGMAELKKGGLEHDEKARVFFQSALDIDPNYSRAFTGLSLSYFNEWSCQLWDRWDVSQKGALEYALKALALDEYDYVALAVAGRALLFSEEYEKAEHYLRKSIRINPNDANNLIQVAFSMIFLELASESVKLYERACELNPLHSDSYMAYGANIYFELGEYQKTIELSAKLNVKNLWVDFPCYVAAAYFHLADYENMDKYWDVFLSQFSINILKSTEINEAEALHWQIRMNPYKGKTNLMPFWDYVQSRKGIGKLPQAKSNVNIPASFTKNGDMWEVFFDQESVLVKDAKGINDLFTLIAAQGKAIHCTELMGAEAIENKGISIIDREAKASYQRKIREIQSEMSDAEELYDHEKLARLNQEYDKLIDHLSGAVGLAGKSRTTGSTIDKARSAVTLRIRSCIKKLEKYHPRLATHLQASIKTGVFCSYKPEMMVDWLF